MTLDDLKYPKPKYKIGEKLFTPPFSQDWDDCKTVTIPRECVIIGINLKKSNQLSASPYDWSDSAKDIKKVGFEIVYFVLTIELEEICIPYECTESILFKTYKECLSYIFTSNIKDI